MIEQRIKCNFGDYAVPGVVHAVQGDTARRFIFEPEDYQIAGNETVALFCIRPDGTAFSYAGTCDSATNTITINLASAGGALTQAGVVAAQIVMTVTGGDVKSFKLGIIVEEALGGTATQEDITFLEGLQAQLDAAIGNFVQSSLMVNGHALTGNIVLTPADIGAVPSSRTVNGLDLSQNRVLKSAQFSYAMTGELMLANLTYIRVATW